MAADNRENSVSPDANSPSTTGNVKKHAQKKSRGTPAWLIRGTMFLGAWMVYACLPSVVPFYTLVIAAAAHATIYLSTSMLKPGDEDWAIGCKRFLNFLNGFATGIPAIFAVLAAYRNEPWWSWVAAGIQLGVYFSDMVLITDKQREMVPLLVHHYITFFGNFGVLWSQNYMVMSIGLCMELTNPFWYGNVLLKFHLGATEETLAISKMLAIYSYILIRFVFVTHKVIEHTFHLYLRLWPTAEGLVYLFVILGFTWVNVNNLVKLTQGGQRRKKD